MPERIYNGPHPEVDVILPDGPVRVKRGEAVEVDQDVAKGLDEQGDTWLTKSAATTTKGKE